MLKYQAISAVLAQTVEQDVQLDATVQQIEQYLHHDATVVISSILATSNGQTVAAHHNTRIPPCPRNNMNEHGATPYFIDRNMKSKIYSLFAASVWQEYLAQSTPNWMSVQTEDALFVIHLVQLKSLGEDSYMLLILVADRETPIGLVANKAKLTAQSLESGLAEYK